MGIISICIIAIGLSIDCLTIVVSISATTPLSNHRNFTFLRFAFILGIMHGLFTFLGWIAGIELEKSFQKYDHWIAFILFSIVGCRFIYNGLRKDKNKGKKDVDINNLLICLALAVATSVDALVVGISITFIDVNVFISILTITFITFLISIIGLYCGKYLSGKLQKFPIDIIGGMVLICIGVYILYEHTALNI